MEARYRSTLWACCFANFFQAVGSCFAILYVPLRGLYGLSFTDFGILVSLNFITQVASDVLFSKPVEKYGFRPFAVAAPLVSAAGLGLFAAAPLLFPRRPFAGFCAGMFLFAAAGGLQELLLSPILDALPIPEERKARSMSMLHSFFAWGQIFVVLACGLTGLCVSLLWPGAIILASRRIPSAGAAMFALLSAGGDVGASLGAFCVGRAADWAQASGTVFAGAAGESGALRAGLLLAAVFPLLCCGVHTALHCSEARAGLPAGSERRRRQ